MKVGIACLVAGYVLSQFYRAFLAVLAPALTAELGASAADLARASAWWFLAFAAMQVPVGWALDRIGPRRLAAGLLGVAGTAGAGLVAAAQGPGAVTLGMALIGIGCSPVLMAGYYIFARAFPAAMFGTLAGAMLGAGTLGNLAASLPLALAAEAWGWRGTVAVLAVATAAVAGLVWRFVIDPPPPPAAPAGAGGIGQLLRMPALWVLIPLALVNYAPSAGLRGLWVGPYFAQAFALDTAGIGRMTLVMGLAMVAGNFAYGPLDRLLGTRKWLVLGGNLAAAACLLALWAGPGSAWGAAALLAGVGLFGASFPMLVAHGRAFFPPHLVGRGVTLLNLCSIGGVGVAQSVSAPVQAATGFAGLFLFFALALVAGCAIYLLAADRTD